MTDNKTRIWDTVEQTDPAFTKKVNQRGGFTAIDPMYNFRRATEVFGPVGRGWWYHIEDSGIDGEGQNAVHWVLVALHYSIKEPTDDERGIFSEPVLAYGCTQMYSGSRLDEDCRKKSLTDALSKALSMLGFSADVYLGKFDNNKYVQSLRDNPPQSGTKVPSQKESIVENAKTSGVLKPASEIEKPETIGAETAQKILKALADRGLALSDLRRAVMRSKVPAKDVPADNLDAWPNELQPKIRKWVAQHKLAESNDD